MRFVGLCHPKKVSVDTAMKKILSLFLFSLFTAPALWAEVPDPTVEGLNPGQRFHLLLERIQVEQKSLRTLESSFVLVQENELLVSAEESRGRLFYSAPEQIRWEYLEPRPLTVVISGDQMTTWYRDLGRAETARVGRYSDRVLRFMNATQSLEGLLEYFEAKVRFQGGEGGSHRIELLPKYKRIARRIKSIVLWIDPVTYLPARVRIEGADGGISDYRFLSMKVNGEIAPETFHLELPDDVEVHSMDLGAASK